VALVALVTKALSGRCIAAGCMACACACCREAQAESAECGMCLVKRGKALPPQHGTALPPRSRQCVPHSTGDTSHILFSKATSAPPHVLPQVLAWGNSLMDYMNNTSMAGKSAGGNSMAMTACYAGPLFNLLIGLGLGFWSLLGERGAASVPVALPLNAAVGLGAIMAVCAAIVAVALANNHWLPQRFGWAMIGWYGVYLTVILLVTVF
jgi:hypothetical protein